jgi:ABC-type transport system involved in multi-copper enzyme maturation permease subunit
MATSSGKTIGLILLVIVILALAWRITPLIVGPFGFFSGAFHTLRLQGSEVFNFGSSIFRFSNSMLSLALLIIWIFVIVWVFRDAERRGMNGVLWALLVLIGNIIGLLIYLILRSNGIPALKEGTATQACPSCQREVDSEFVFCPYCAARLHAVCPECGKPAEENWKVCPHCGKKLKAQMK